MRQPNKKDSHHSVFTDKFLSQCLKVDQRLEDLAIKYKKDSHHSAFTDKVLSQSLKVGLRFENLAMRKIHRGNDSLRFRQLKAIS